MCRFMFVSRFMYGCWLVSLEQAAQPARSATRFA
ncbi:hypothetical protein ACVMB1_001709 [Bradyrhizobium sp. USDA 4504]